MKRKHPSVDEVLFALIAWLAGALAFALLAFAAWGVWSG